MSKFGYLRPLFDRLTDEAPHSSQDLAKNVVGPKATADSVYNEIKNLFKSRWQINYHFHTLDSKRKPDVFGLPDFSKISPSSVSNWPIIAEHLARLIAFYEPRLHSVKVTILRYVASRQRLSVQIEGSLMIADVNFPVHFPIDIENL